MKLAEECGIRARAEKVVRVMTKAVVATAVLDLQRGSRG
jgi:hypothetical protein